MEEEKKRVHYSETIFSVRGRRAFQDLGVEYLDEMAEHSVVDLKRLRSIGKVTIQEIRKVLGQHGLCLRGDILVSSEDERKILTEIPDLLRKFWGQLTEIEQKINWIKHQMECMIESRRQLDTK
jgi:hypothetical protein